MRRDAEQRKGNGHQAATERLLDSHFSNRVHWTWLNGTLQ